MPDFDLTDTDKKVLSYCSRGVNKTQALDKMADFFQIKQGLIIESLDKLRRHGLVIESKGVAGIAVYMNSPLKVKSVMIDEKIVEALKEMEKGGKASAFKHKTFTTDVHTGEIVEEGMKKAKPKPKGTDIGFEVY